MIGVYIQTIILSNEDGVGMRAYILIIFRLVLVSTPQIFENIQQLQPPADHHNCTSYPLILELLLSPEHGYLLHIIDVLLFSPCCAMY